MISRVEAKFKLGQNRSADDITGVIVGLEAEGDAALAGETASAGATKLEGR